ncbi:MAG: DUF1573 domain-containing protein [Flavobacteriia bacterium]|nr:DUF1573 domain-containing protein [Flavobacteriia bacterium]
MLIFLTSLSFVAQETVKEKTKTEKKAKKKKEALTFNTYTIERNGIPYGSDETFSFEFKNNSKAPIIITNVGTSCGCTTASKPEKPINPKEKSVISVKYDTKRVGPFTKEITVTNNATEEPIKLVIKGTVNPEGVKN